MRLAVSNIAWPSECTDDAYACLQDNGVTGLEIAPGLFFRGEEDPFVPTNAGCRAAMQRAADAGLSLISMQSLLFGVSGASLFGNSDERSAFYAGICRAIDLGSRLEIPNLVVGSPRNRAIPPSDSVADAWRAAIEVFRRLGSYARTQGCVLAIEPNPAIYGTNFLTDMETAYKFVLDVAHPGVTLNFDIGSLHANAELDNIVEFMLRMKHKVSHVHISELNLQPVPVNKEHLKYSIDGLRSGQWGGWISIEMIASADSPIAFLNHAVKSCAACLSGGEDLIV